MLAGLMAALYLLWSSAPSCDWQALTAPLQQRVDKDQQGRQAWLQQPRSSALGNAVVQVDKDNREWFRPVLEACGWPRVSIVGETAARNAWLLAQHADMDPVFQRFAASEMKKAVLEGEAKGERLALLVDRNARINKTAQTYGMQFLSDGQAIRFLPVAEPDGLDARRREIGLPPFICYYRKVQKDHPGTVLWPEGVPRAEARCDDP